MPSPTRWKLLSGDAHPALARDLAGELNVPLGPVEITHFADGEAGVRIADDVRGAAVFVLQPTSPPVAEHLLTKNRTDFIGRSDRHLFLLARSRQP